MENSVQDRVSKVVQKIKENRAIKGYSHDTMALELDISASAYNKIERQETKLTLERFFKIAQVLQVKEEKLLEIKPEKIYNQEFNDNSYFQDIQNLYQENKGIIEKLIESYTAQIQQLREENVFLKSLIQK